MNGERIFYCKYPEYSSISFNRVLNHSWERHNSISQGFEYKCDISSCTRKYSNIQSFKRHLKSHHSWFYDSFVRPYAGDNHNDFDDLVSGFLLELREKYSTATEVTCFVSEQVSKILVLDGKIRNSKLKNSLNRNGNFPLGYEPDMIYVL